MAFGEFIRQAHRNGQLVVQPRMGMGSPDLMRAGLLATRDATATTVGTLTVDSYSRTGEIGALKRAISRGADLNGYPLVGYGSETTRSVLRGVAGETFPVQVRHGSAAPQEIFRSLIAAGLDATEGGPVSYCLPYGRTPLRQSVSNWERCCDMLAAHRGGNVEPHLETFGGCLLGQLCPPSLLIAISVLEAMFFRSRGIRSLSLSYAQQANVEQDVEAVAALRRIAGDRLPDTEWHVVVYTYMGLYPKTGAGARRLLDEAVRLAVRTGSERLIVKTTAEAHRIPTVEENVSALEAASGTAARERGGPFPIPLDTGIAADADRLMDAVLELDGDIGRALVKAFAAGRLDVPYCLHPDNAGRARSFLDSAGRLHWSRVGSMPLRSDERFANTSDLSSAGLMSALSHVRRVFDRYTSEPSAASLPL